MSIRIFLIIAFILSGLVSLATAQVHFSLEDLNPNSETFGYMIGPSDYVGDVCVLQFSHEY